MSLRSFLLAVATACSLPPASAADPAPAAELDPIVVTATRTAARESETLAAITVIGRADIERAQASDVAELLRFVAGVEIARSGGPGQLAAAFIRGGNSQHTLVLLDGVRLNPTTQGAALQNLSPEMIDHIEIVRGPRSTLYGSDAMGGVVHIFTRRPAGSTLNLETRYGSYETGALAGGGAWAGERATVSAHAAQLDSRGFAPHSDSARERAHRNTTLEARGDLRLEALTLGASAWNAQGRTGYLEDDDPFCFPCTYDAPAALDFHNRALAAEARWTPRAELAAALTLERTLDENRVVEGIFTGSQTRNERTTARWQGTRSGEGTRATLSLEGARERTRAGGVAEERDVGTGALSVELWRGRHRALLAGSVLDHDAFGGERLWNAEYGYEVGKTRWSLGAGTGFRAPNVIERFFPGFGNPDLAPERARSYEAGVRRRFGRAQLELRAFRTDYDNLVQFDPTTFLAGNVGHARNEGLELGARWPLGAATSLRLGGVLQDPRECAPGCGDGAPLVRRARRSATLQLVTQWRGVEYGLDALGSGPRADFDSGDFSRTRLPGYALLNLTAGATFGGQWSLGARLENLLEQRYETIEGYRQPGRSAAVTLRWVLQ
jgi:vitamin B12 transporter